MNEKIQSLETELVTIKTVTVTVTETETETDEIYDSSTPEEVLSEVRVKLVKPPRQVGHLHKEILAGRLFLFAADNLYILLVRSGDRPLSEAIISLAWRGRPGHCDGGEQLQDYC